MLLVDAEIRRFGVEAEVAELAERLGIPVVTTFMGRGLLADAPNPPIGTYIGVAGQPDITRLVEGSDALRQRLRERLIGVRFVPMTGKAQGKKQGR